MLINDNYQWDENRVKLGTLTQACKIQNDCLTCRLPIHKTLFEQLLFELERILDQQYYLCAMYKAIFCLAYYGLMRITELVHGDHTLKAKDIYVGQNKDKIMLTLYTSKTHSRAHYPQKIKITANEERREANIKKGNFTFFCPFEIVGTYFRLRGDYAHKNEEFFIFRDRTVVSPSQVRSILRFGLKRLGLEASLYGTHSFRIGRCSDLMKAGVPLEEIKRRGRWKSNAVFRYMRDY